MNAGKKAESCFKLKQNWQSFVKTDNLIPRAKSPSSAKEHTTLFFSLRHLKLMESHINVQYVR